MSNYTIIKLILLLLLITTFIFHIVMFQIIINKVRLVYPEFYRINSKNKMFYTYLPLSRIIVISKNNRTSINRIPRLIFILYYISYILPRLTMILLILSEI